MQISEPDFKVDHTYDFSFHILKLMFIFLSIIHCRLLNAILMAPILYFTFMDFHHLFVLYFSLSMRSFLTSFCSLCHVPTIKTHASAHVILFIVFSLILNPEFSKILFFVIFSEYKLRSFGDNRWVLLL